MKSPAKLENEYHIKHFLNENHYENGKVSESETVSDSYPNSPISNKLDRKSQMESLIKDFLLSLCEGNLNEEVINNTPRRFTEALLELTEGYETDIESIIKNALFDNEGYDDIIIIKDIEFSSTCEHHLLPFYGKVNIGYIPNNKVLGLSKFPRVIQALSKKLGLQERLTKEIAQCLHDYTEALGVAVQIESQHSCMSCRGIRCIGSSTVTLFTTGNMKDPLNLKKFFMLRDL